MRHPPTSDALSRQRFEEIYAANHDRIIGYVLRRTIDPDDAADAVGETFLVAWRRIADVPRGEEARLWLYGVARRVLAEQRRQTQRHSRAVSELTVQLRASLKTYAADSHGAPDRADAREGLADAFRSLPEGDREVLGLVGWEGLTPTEIARVLDCSPTTARVRLHRARRRFARELDRRDVAPAGLSRYLCSTSATTTGGPRCGPTLTR